MRRLLVIFIVFAVAVFPALAGDPPSMALSGICREHLDQILAPIDQDVNLPRNQVMELRQSFINWMAKAPTNEQPAWHTAISLCDALNNAMDEREKARAGVDAASSVHGATDLGAHRKDRPRYWEYEREKNEAAQRKEEARQKDGFLNTTLRTNWTQRTARLRQNIVALQGRLQELELKAQQRGGQAVLPSSDTITIQKPTSVSVKYGHVTLPVGTSLRVVSRDSRGITAEYNGELVIVPPQ
jgi:hypothetical protein